MRKILKLVLVLLFTSSIFFAQDAIAEATPKYQEGVIVNTDKQEYEQEETIKIIIKNELSDKIFSHAGSHTPVFSITYVEIKTLQGWKQLFAQCQHPHCVYDIDAPAEIGGGQYETFDWKPLIYTNGTEKYIQAEPGEYRLMISYQIRKDSVAKDWKWLTVYSNEFIIK
ncbi:MAG: hypothetical protein PVI33_03445 [Candidatus Omnitrophota bacterium]|jgi:hypothetical protein